MRPLKTTYLGQALVTATWILSPTVAFADYTPPIIDSSLNDQQLSQGSILSDKSVDGQYYYYSADPNSVKDHEDAKLVAKDFNPQWDNLFRELSENINSTDRYNAYRETLTQEENVVLPTILDASHPLDIKTLKENSSAVLNFNSNITGDAGFTFSSSANQGINPILSLNGDNSYSGTTEILNNAKLNVDGRLANSSVVVREGGEFSGRGLVKELRVENGAQIFGFSRANPELSNSNLKTEDFNNSYANSLLVDGDLTLEKGASAAIRLGQPIISNRNINLNDNTLIVSPGNTLDHNGYYTGEVLVAKDYIVGKFAEIKTRNALLSVEGVAVINNHTKLQILRNNQAVSAVEKVYCTLRSNPFEYRLFKIDAKIMETSQSLGTLINSPTLDDSLLGLEKTYKVEALKLNIQKLRLEQEKVRLESKEHDIDNLNKQIRDYQDQVREYQDQDDPENLNAEANKHLESEITRLKGEAVELYKAKAEQSIRVTELTVKLEVQKAELEKLKNNYLNNGGSLENISNLTKALPVTNSPSSTTPPSNDSSDNSNTSADDETHYEVKGQTLVVSLKSRSALAAFEEENKDLLISDERDAATTIDDVRKAIPGLDTDLGLLSNKEIVETAQVLFAPEYGQFLSVASTANRLARDKAHLSLLTQHENTDLAITDGISYDGNLVKGGENGLLNINQLNYFNNSGYNRFNAGFTFSNNHFKGTFSEVKSNLSSTGAYLNYGRYLPEYNFLATVGLSLNHFSGTVHRRGRFLSKAVNLDKDYDSTLLSFDLGLSQKYHFSLGAGTLAVTPFAGLGFTTNFASSVNENLGNYALDIKGGNQVAVNARLGLKAEYKLNQALTVFSNYTLDYSANNTKKVLKAKVTEIKGSKGSTNVKLHVKDKALLHALDFGVEYRVSDSFKASLYGEVLHRNGFTGGLGFKAEYTF